MSGRASSVRQLRGAGALTPIYLFALLVWALAHPHLAWLPEAVSAHGWAGINRMGFEKGLTACCALAVTLCGAWLVLVSTATVVAAVRGATTGTRPHPLFCPRRLHRVLFAACGVALTAGLTAGPSTADPVDHADRAGASGSPLAGLAVPDRTSGERPRTAVVNRGDSLWVIAEAALGPDATTGAVAAASRAIYSTNAQQIGDDPDLILPGTTLQMPDLSHYRKDQP